MFYQVVRSSHASNIFSENATKLVSIAPLTAEIEDLTFRQYPNFAFHHTFQWEVLPFAIDCCRVLIEPDLLVTFH